MADYYVISLNDRPYFVVSEASTKRNKFPNESETAYISRVVAQVQSVVDKENSVNDPLDRAVIVHSTKVKELHPEVLPVERLNTLRV